MAQIQAYEIKDAVKTVTTKEIKRYTVENPEHEVVMMDFGYKAHILRHLLNRNCNVTVVPAHTTAEEILAINPDGVMLTNGPGNPEENTEVIETLKKLIAAKMPMFGICLGHQLTALANGGKTMKLKYGHRGGNHPVKDLTTGNVFITSQNHNYIVADLPDTVEETFVNVNDGTCEGIRHKTLPIQSVQFHPEASPGPLDTGWLFDRFLKGVN